MKKQKEERNKDTARRMFVRIKQVNKEDVFLKGIL